jgi:TonB-dependent starch-binding outer membrane protein SusC
MKRILLLSMVFSFVFALSAWAQRTVSGRVTDDKGEGLPGVNVIIKGTTTGVTTDMDGRFSISVPGDDAVLVFSSVGMATQEVAVGSRSVIDVKMAMDTRTLQEVVVVGYGEIDKRKLTSAISQVSGEQLAAMPVPSFDVALQGKAAGVQVSTTSGILGSAPRIRIRGANSISSGTAPLIVIDGVPMETGNFSGTAPNNGLADINMADVESFEVLKDGPATAIYGSRAANGVILITTKKGKAGTTSVNYDFYVGQNQVANRFELLNAAEFVTISNEKFATTNTAPQAFMGEDENGKVWETDWQDIIFRRGMVQSHNLSISGGNDQSKFYLSVGYMSQEGHVVNNSIERFSARANIDYTGVSWLDAGIKVQVSQQNNEGLNTGTNALSGNISNAMSAFPNIHPMNPDHPTGYNISSDNTTMGRGNNLQNIAFNLPNIKYVLDNNFQISTTQRMLANGYAQANLPQNFKLRTQIGFDVADTRDNLSRNPLHGDGRPLGYVYRGYQNATTWNWQNTLSWNGTFSDVHNVSAIVGNEYQKSRYDYFAGSAQDFSDIFFMQQGLISGTYGVQYADGNVSERGFESVFGRVNYDYDSRYLFSASFRRDGLSQLPEVNRFGTFFGASLGWVVSDESFFNVSSINQLKVRGGFAETGNTNIGFFPYLGTYEGELYGDYTAIRFGQAGNGSLQWETSKKWNVGIDFSILSNNRLTGSFDYYTNDVDGLILFAPTPPSLGIPGNGIFTNIGSLVNSGIELSLNSVNVQTQDLTWTTSFNITSNKNEVTGLAGNDDDITLTYNIVRKGESIGAIYGYVYKGVNPANGNPLFQKADGTIVQGTPENSTWYVYDPANPGVLGAVSSLSATEDKKVIGQSVPKFFGGMTHYVGYKNFDVSVNLTYAFGHQLLNVTAQEAMSMNFSNNIALIKDRWTPNNTQTNVPRLYSGADNFLNQDSHATTRFLENAGFVRVQNITVGYTLPQTILQNVSLKRARVYASVQNAFVFTGYTGLDPELNFSNTSNQQNGVDYNTNPLMRTYIVGLNVGF